MDYLYWEYGRSGHTYSCGRQVSVNLETGTVELYQYCGVTALPGAVGKLSYFLPGIPDQLMPRLRPAVLILPGGGYSHTSQREMEPVALHFTARGWAAFTLEYTCAPSAAFPAQLREAAMAMRYIRENGDRFAIAGDGTAAIGFSAGGHLCGLLGTLFAGPELSDIAPPEIVRPDALGLCYPVAVSWGRTHEGSFENISGGDPALRARLSLDKLVRPDMPPVFLWHTRDDGSVPVRNSILLANALEEAGVDFSLRIYRHGQHGLSTADDLVYRDVPDTSPDVPGWLDSMMGFFTELGFRIRDL